MRPTGARCVPGLSHPSHWQQGPEALASAVFLGLMRILSKNFEFVVIESNYADYELLNKN